MLWSHAWLRFNQSLPSSQPGPGTGVTEGSGCVLLPGSALLQPLLFWLCEGIIPGSPVLGVLQI